MKLSSGRLRRTITASAAVAASAVVALGLAACAPASDSSELKTDASLEASIADWRIQMDDCMLAAGFDLTTGGDDASSNPIDTSQFDMEEFDKAYTSCIDQVGEPPVDESLPTEEEMFESQLIFAKCMREAGYDYPDPAKGAGGMMPAFGPETNPDDLDSCWELANSQVSK